MIKDLNSYIDHLGKAGRLAKVGEESSTDIEISAMTNLESRERRNEARALLFERPSGYDMPVITNLMGSMSVLRGLFSGLDLPELISGMHGAGGMQMVKGARALMDSRPRVTVRGMRGFERLGSLDELPVLRVWPKDAGRFITLPLVITKSPKDGSTNVGIYRMQVHDSETTGMHWQAQKGGALHSLEAKDAGKMLNVSVAIGTDPYNIVAAVAPLPQGVNEFAFAGMARGAGTALMDCGEYPAVPANSEIVINGHVDPLESRTEGPFGDHTGYYSIPEPASVFHVDGIYARKGAVYAASVVGFPWNEDAVAGQFLMDYLKPMIRLVNGSITDIYLPPEGSFTNMCFISVKKRFPGDAKKAMFSVLGLGQLSVIKMLVAFDEDVDIRNMGSVMWAMSSRIDPDRDVQVLKGTPTDTLDHAAGLPAYGSKILIDATKKSAGEGYGRKWPEVISLSKELADEAERKWRRIR